MDAGCLYWVVQYNVRLENVNITDANIGVFVHKQAEVSTPCPDRLCTVTCVVSLQLEMNNCVITMCSDTGMVRAPSVHCMWINTRCADRG